MAPHTNVHKKQKRTNLFYFYNEKKTHKNPQRGVQRAVERRCAQPEESKSEHQF